MSHQGFIFSRAQHTRGSETRLIFQGRLSDGRRFRWAATRPRVVFFIAADEEWTAPGAHRRPVELRDLRGRPVHALYFPTSADLSRARSAYAAKRIPTYEADVNTASRFLMERFVQASVCFKSEPTRAETTPAGIPLLHFEDPEVEPGNFTPATRMLSIDIETSLGTDLYSIALWGPGIAKVFVRAPEAESGADYTALPSEAEVLRAAFREIRAYDPDALIGWNVVGFDLRWLSQKCDSLGLPFDIGVDGPADILEPGANSNQWIARVPGRAVLDGISLLRGAFVQLDDYSLNTASHELLGESKLIESSGKEKAREITLLFENDRVSLAKYNLKDAKLVLDIFEKLDLAPLAVRKSQLTGLAVDRVGGSVAAFDFLYLPRLHRKGFVADTDPRPPAGLEAAPGGLVLDSRPGFYRNIIVLDFKSLYPSIMRTFKIDPLAAHIVLGNLLDEEKRGPISKGPAGLGFARDHAILPAIIDELWSERDRAKKNGDAALSQAVKIIMNSFYGVLGSPGCRFFDPRLAGTITRIGHWILNHSRDYIEEKGLEVIYGDTDSLFVSMGDGDLESTRRASESLTRELNRHLEDFLAAEFQVDSVLDIEFERVFTRFFMPTIRGEDTGSKKRYAGLLPDGVVYFTGMESNRRDWTALARDFQRDLFRLVFQIELDDADAEDALITLIRGWKDKLYDGALDDQLVYRKGLSKAPSEYVKNVPPHVRAALMLGDEFEGRVIRYVITTEGPEPASKRSAAKLDYEHYSEKQLGPIADAVLRFFDTDYNAVTGEGKQLGLF